MVLEIFFLLLFTVLDVNAYSRNQDIHSRAKRFGVFNRGGATRARLIMGFGFPLELENEAITMGMVTAAYYQLPYNISQYKPNYFPGLIPGYVPSNFFVNNDFGRFKREIRIDELTGQKYESYEGELEEIGNEALNNVSAKDFPESSFDDEFIADGKNPQLHSFPQPNEEQLYDTSGSRWLLYDGIGKLLNSKGLVGRPCVLRAICDAAQSQFTHHTGLVGELLHIIFSPSTSSDPIVKRDHHDYIKAESLGLADEPCNQIFHECKDSLLDIFSRVQGGELFNFN